MHNSFAFGPLPANILPFAVNRAKLVQFLSNCKYSNLLSSFSMYIILN